jgi:ABC-2 type transport system permease protein
LKTSFVSFWRKNLAFFRLAVLSNLEYRLNFFTDAVLQPFCTSLIELTLWFAVFASATTSSIGGFTREYYLAYALWTAFVARIATSWMYEFRMIEEIESGTINGLLVRPISFFEYYLSQLLGYKAITTVISLLIPLAMVAIFKLPTIYSRIPLALLLIGYYLVLVHTIGFIVSSLAFHLNRIYSITGTKNLALWLVSGELIPIDLLPEPYKSWILNLPFCNGVYIPVAYVTGRVNTDMVAHGFLTTTAGLAVFGLIAFFMWTWGLRKYVGTGA